MTKLNKPTKNQTKKKPLKKIAIINTQNYYITSKLVPPVGNPYSWDVSVSYTHLTLQTTPYV